jgi:hypothetical protein
MTMMIRRLIATALLLPAVLLSDAGLARAAACSGKELCSDLGSFSVQLTDIRTSVAGRFRVVSVTMHFVNSRNTPLILGYVAGSGVITDDQGNRYQIATNAPNSVRAIGVVNASTFDPKFVLQPAEGSDARFEFLWQPGRSIIGTVFDMALSVREIEPLAARQFRLGREHLLEFGSLSDHMKAASLAPGGPPMPAANASAGASPGSGGCGNAPRCLDAGPFTTSVLQVIASTTGRWHLVRFNLRVRNTSGQPLILAYLASSGTMADNLGNRYVCDTRVTGRVSGIGLTNAQQADPQFMLQPGEARDFSVEYGRRVDRTQIGTTFSPDLTLQALEVLPSRQIRPTRDFSINFVDLAAGGPAVGKVDAVNDITQATQQITQGLRSLFKPHR